MSKLLSKNEVANYFNVTLPTINRWMRIGYLPFIKIGRRVLFDPQSIEIIKARFTVTKSSDEPTYSAQEESAIPKSDYSLACQPA